MKTTRREFIRYVGVALGSLMAVSCGTCYLPAVTPTPTPTASSRVTTSR